MMRQRTNRDDREPEGDAIELLLPGHRGPFAVHDFRDMEARSSEKEIVDHVYRAACPRLRFRCGQITLRLPSDAPRDRNAERITAQAYRDMLAQYAKDAQASGWRLMPQAMGLIALGAAILVAVHFLEAKEEGTVLGAMGSVLQVGGWVALWTAISVLFSVFAGFWRRARTLRHLAERPLHFRYADVEPYERFDREADKLSPAVVASHTH
jgi:hypothetical protein